MDWEDLWLPVAGKQHSFVISKVGHTSHSFVALKTQVKEVIINLCTRMGPIGPMRRAPDSMDITNPLRFRADWLTTSTLNESYPPPDKPSLSARGVSRFRLLSSFVRGVYLIKDK